MTWYMVEILTAGGWLPAGTGLGNETRAVAEDYARGIAARRGEDQVRVVKYIREETK